MHIPTDAEDVSAELGHCCCCCWSPGAPWPPLPGAAARDSALALAEEVGRGDRSPQGAQGAMSSCSSHRQSNDPVRAPIISLAQQQGRGELLGKGPSSLPKPNFVAAICLVFQSAAAAARTSLIPPSCKKPHHPAWAGRTLTLCLSGSTNRMPK